MTRKEELKAQLEVIDKEYDDLWNAGYPPSVWWEKAQEVGKRANPLSGELHMIEDEYELNDIPDYGDKIPLKTFVDCCKYHGFINDDGEGYYATEDKESSIPAVPSEIVAGFVRKDFPYVVWYNK